MSDIDWDAIANSLPSTSADLLCALREACDTTDEPARAVELALKERLSELQRRFDEIKKIAP
jgi:hypothetical protein